MTLSLGTECNKPYRHARKTNSSAKLKRVPCNCFAIKNAGYPSRPFYSSSTTVRHSYAIVDSRTARPFGFFPIESQDRVDSMATRKRIYASIKLHQADCSIDPSVRRNKFATCCYTSVAARARLLSYGSIFPLSLFFPSDRNPFPLLLGGGRRRFANRDPSSLERTVIEFAAAPIRDNCCRSSKLPVTIIEYTGARGASNCLLVVAISRQDTPVITRTIKSDCRWISSNPSHGTEFVSRTETRLGQAACETARLTDLIKLFANDTGRTRAKLRY